jgi:soluble cytochrome b562
MSISSLNTNNPNLLTLFQTSQQNLLEMADGLAPLQIPSSNTATGNGLSIDMGSLAEELQADGIYAPQTGSSNSGSNFMSDLSQLMQGAQSGNTQTMQQAANSVVQDLQSIYGSSTSANSNASSSSSGMGQILSDLGNLVTAVQSGNTQTAQSTAQSLQQDLGNLSNGAASPTLNNLLTAASSGDTPTAQAAVNALTNDLQSLYGSSNSSTPTSAASTQNASSSLGQFFSNLSSLLSAAQSGNTQTAQSAAQNLQQDLANLGLNEDPNSAPNGNSGPGSTTNADNSAAMALATYLQNQNQTDGQPGPFFSL